MVTNMATDRDFLAQMGSMNLEDDQGLQQILDPSTSEQVAPNPGGNQTQQSVRRKTIYTRTDMLGRSVPTNENNSLQTSGEAQTISQSSSRDNAIYATLTPRIGMELNKGAEPYKIKKTQSMPNTPHGMRCSIDSFIPPKVIPQMNKSWTSLECKEQPELDKRIAKN
ncbi:uncharacterized protein LOC110180562 [Drosophila serrata]|uniref:uncharacterized protein LOC110180562 n=1 Tax=Drosophila serrata TaxID=7274 RepID=UPI000A1D190A|nr:uncharacterized protein LOC110180562 [Drosophila serrata]